MKKSQKKALAAVIFTLFGVTITACNSGVASTATPVTQNQTNILPDGTFILPNGAKSSIANPYALVQLGKVTSTTLSVTGGSSTVTYELGATAYLVQNGIYTPTNLVTISFSNPNVTTGAVAPSTAQVFVDATKAPQGFYVIAVNSKSLVNQSSQNTQPLSSLSLSAESATFHKASYVQLDATGSLDAITAAGYSASNVMVFAFASLTSPLANQNYLAVMKKVVKNEGLGTINVLSVGGATAKSDVINLNTVAAIVSNVDAQIKAYNTELPGNGQIKGVDLDLEWAIDGDIIAALAQKFNALGYVVSVAPQIYKANGVTNVDSATPANLALSSGWDQAGSNQYQKAIASGNVAYIMVQTYNSDGWTIDNYGENQLAFFSAAARALSNTVKSSCVGTTNLCIPATTQILIGEPSNAGAAGSTANIFGVFGTPYSYNQATILAQLNTQITTVAQGNYPNLVGVMQWSLNNDFAPNSVPWLDNSAVAGEFSSTIFGANSPTPPTPTTLPYFTLQVTNTAQTAKATATLVINSGYYVFGDVNGQSILPSANRVWGTLRSAQNPSTPYVTDSSNLDTFFSSGATSFTTQQILINSDRSSNQVSCAAGSNYTFEAGKSYNLQVNPDTGTCKIN
ncbi:MAG: hypothetical protein K2Y14_08680 [Burkholderiales bacterium]|nr:hypothetical protein [Burkholderiales bacterium]